MSLNISVDDDLVNEALKISDVKSKNELVELALKEFIESIKRKKLLELKGKIEFFDNYDYKKMRAVN